VKEEIGAKGGTAATTAEAPTASRPSSASGRRLNVQFSESVYRALEELAQRKGTSMAEVLRDAVQLEKWVEDARAEGGRILIERDGNIRELVLR
jgi:hypothetical protein